MVNKKKLICDRPSSYGGARAIQFRSEKDVAVERRAFSKVYAEGPLPSKRTVP